MYFYLDMFVMDNGTLHFPNIAIDQVGNLEKKMPV